jgi:hypothetical protein
MKTRNMTTPDLRKLISWSPLRLAFLLIPLALGCFALSPAAQAVTPAPDGGYPGNNTAEGTNALFSLTTGTLNTAIGGSALFSNTTGLRNTADGSKALKSNTTGVSNTANGTSALVSNTTGGGNTAVGVSALFSNTTASLNAAFGDATMFLNATGTENTAFGTGALQGNTTGNGNIALGAFAGYLATGDNNIDIGSFGVEGESNTIRIGGETDFGSQTATFIAGISGTAVVGDTVVVDGNGQLGTVASSARFKKEIRPMDKTSEAILALKPVSFQYKSDTKGTPQFGLIAEEVAKVNPDLVVRDRKGEIYSVRYEAVNAMLLNEFLKEHRTVQQLKSAAARQEANIAQLKSTVARQEAAIAKQKKDSQTAAAQQQEQIKALTASVKEQASQIQKVSAQLEVSRPAPQTVLNNQ